MNEVTLPKGKWRYFFDDSKVIEGPVTFKKEFPLEEFPVFIREGAIVPMDIKRSYTEIGDEFSEGFLTFLIYPGSKSNFTVYHPDKTGSTTVQVIDSKEKINITLNGVQKPHILNIHLEKMPIKVELDGRQLSDTISYSFNKSAKKLVIRTQEYSIGNYNIIKNADAFQNFRKPKNGIYVIAHRGAHQGIPENSLPAYQKAIDLGCDFVEIDIRTTRDGQFVSVHNSTIDSYVDGKTGSVRNMTLAELKALDIGLKTGAEWKGTQIPTFEEILQLCQGKIGIYLDLKDASIPELMVIIRKYNMENDIVWYIPYQYLVPLCKSGIL